MTFLRGRRERAGGSDDRALMRSCVRESMTSVSICSDCLIVEFELEGGKESSDWGLRVDGIATELEAGSLRMTAGADSGLSVGRDKIEP